MEYLKLRTESNLGKPAARHRAGAIRLRARGLGLACLGAVMMLVSGCRLDMHLQPKYLPYEPSEFFADGRSERQPVPGTIARGHLRIDELLYSGRENGVEADRFPFPITRADLERGQQRYNIYCAPCHDYSGSGRGMIVQRGFPQPPSYHVPRLRQASVGHFVQVMTNGFGAMYSYAARVEPADRWRIAAYIRALQLSQNASLQDVPEAERQKLAQAPAPESSAEGGKPAAGESR
jgi:mono/diheme cytochrome c family protein